MRILLLLSLAATLGAQEKPPAVVDARLETRPLSGNLSATIASVAPKWFGYRVASVGEHSNGCCDGNANCSLEEKNYTSNRVHAVTPVPLEESKETAILFRVENNAVGKIRAFPLSCSLDAGGLSFVWLTGVTSAESLSYLTGFVRKEENKGLADGAVFAIAQHADSKADALLDGFTRPEEPEHVREAAIFWLGASRGAAALPVLEKLLANDESEQIRDKAVFALSISHQPAALDDLIRTAKLDDSPHIRGQALFWLAQKAGNRAESAISDAIENDPDTEVKKRAVFALSQLPRDEAVPKLIAVARSQKNLEVRKQAFFWLGQTNDPRALAFIASVLQN